MIRPVTCLCAAMAAGSFLYLYQVKRQSQALDSQINALATVVRQTHDRTAALRTDWSRLTQPDRLQALADRFLDLKETQPTQFVQFADLATKLPPPQTSAPAAMDQDEDSETDPPAPVPAPSRPVAQETHPPAHPAIAAATPSPRPPAQVAESRPPAQVAESRPPAQVAESRPPAQVAELPAAPRTAASQTVPPQAPTVTASATPAHPPRPPASVIATGQPIPLAPPRPAAPPVERRAPPARLVEAPAMTRAVARPPLGAPVYQTMGVTYAGRGGYDAPDMPGATRSALAVSLPLPAPVPMGGGR